MEKVGVHKRDIMVDCVKEARETQQEAKEQFLTAMEQFKKVVKFEGAIWIRNTTGSMPP